MKKLNGLFSKGLAGKLIRFVIIFVLGLGLVFFVMLYVQTSLLKKAVKDEEVSRLNLIQGEYRQSMDEYNEDSLLQLNHSAGACHGVQAYSGVFYRPYSHCVLSGRQFIQCVLQACQG